MLTKVRMTVDTACRPLDDYDANFPIRLPLSSLVIHSSTATKSHGKSKGIVVVVRSGPLPSGVRNDFCVSTKLSCKVLATGEQYFLHPIILIFLSLT